MGQGAGIGDPAEPPYAGAAAAIRHHPNGSGPSVGYGLGILHFGDWLGHDGAIFGFSTETFYDPKTGAEITSTANLSTLFSTPTLAIFGTIAQHLYPESLRSRRAS